jgi:hypothetical protein
MMPPPPPGAGTFNASGSYTQQVLGSGCNYYQVEGKAGGAACAQGDTDPGCQAGSCLDGIDNDGDGKTDLVDPDCVSNETQDWSDLYFNADIPAGANITFDMRTTSKLDMMGNPDFSASTYSRIATVTSSSNPCATNADCVAMNGFCGRGGQCQFITPPKLNGVCSTTAQCLNGPSHGSQSDPIVASFCNGTAGECQYTTPPADIGGNLMQGQNGKPWMQVKITLNATPDQSKTPTLYDWFLEYSCRGNL